jgi:glycosyltransferase involved in cell wall biosynthesis
LQIIGKGSTNGINTSRFNINVLDEKVVQEIKSSIHFSNRFVYLLCIGRLVADKGIVELVHVFETLQKKHAHLKLVLVGDFETALDPLPQDILEHIKSNSGIIHIQWTQQVEYYMNIANLFVFPSHREGFPNVLLQAGAMQLPIICSRIPGNIDIVTQQQTGLIFETADEADMEARVQYALDHPGQMQNMAVQLHQIVTNDYRRENIWQNILATYNSLLLLDH